jgi:cyclopropane-fatty-acyl-phospholipid synthase
MTLDPFTVDDRPIRPQHEPLGGTAPRDHTQPSTDGLSKWAVAAMTVLRGIRAGTMVVVVPDGRRFHFSGPEPGPVGEIHVADAGAVARKLLFNGDTGIAEAYMEGLWTSPDLAALTELGAKNKRILGDAFDGKWLSVILRRLSHVLRRNSRRGSKRNIAYHYDLGNAFYEKWLDGTMTYSSALFEGEEQQLEAAQTAKYRRIAGLLELRPDTEVLEIGCGWGGFASVAAREFGAKVVGITLSREQHDAAQARLQREGLTDRVEIRLQDYRDVRESFDRVASIEMFEAVGKAYWPVYFDKVRDVLKPGGTAALQVITIDDRWFESYQRTPDFIQRYIFPGGMLPSPAAFAEHVQRAGMRIVEESGFARHYARTLEIWRARFIDAWSEIEPLGFDDRFRRMWEYYLAYCEGGFRSGHIDVKQYALARD